MAAHRSKPIVLVTGLAVLPLALTGCTSLGSINPFVSSAETCESLAVAADVEPVRRFREAETERASQLLQEIERLQADLKTAEAALVEAESGLAGSHTRADAVSSLAVTRIQIERARSRAPWRASEIEDARAKLDEAERQVAENRFGAALFFVYRARRVTESILDEARLVQNDRHVQIVRASRVNLRSGPSTSDPVLSVLNFGTPIFPQAEDGDWILVQVSAGPVGWIHRRLIGESNAGSTGVPAAMHP